MNISDEYGPTLFLVSVRSLFIKKNSPNLNLQGYENQVDSKLVDSKLAKLNDCKMAD